MGAEGFEFPCTQEGETMFSLRWRITDSDGAEVSWVSGTIQIFDVTPGEGSGAALTGFTSPVAATVAGDDSEYIEWWPVWGSGTGLLPALSRNARYLVRFSGTDAAGKVAHSPLVPWMVEAT